jgi:VanZ family protein
MLAVFGLWLAMAGLYFSHHTESAASWSVALAIHLAMALRLAEVGTNSPIQTTLALFVPAFVLAYGDTNRTRLLYKILVMWLCGLVVYFSGNAGGPDPMREWIAGTFQLTPDQTEPVLFGIRKSIHLTFYGCVSGFAFSLATRWPVSLKSALRFAALATLLLAIFDEGRQAMTTMRTGQALDVLIDITGGLVALSILKRRSSATAS